MKRVTIKPVAWAEVVKDKVYGCICGYTNKIIFVTQNPIMFVAIDNVSISKEKCDMRDYCFNTDCKYCNASVFEEGVANIFRQHNEDLNSTDMNLVEDFKKVIESVESDLWADNCLPVTENVINRWEVIEDVI